MTPVFIFIVFIGIAIAVRLFAGSFDGDRVENYVRERGGRLLEKKWAPFGKGWFGEKDSRIYEISYVDRDGNTHRATCKTSLFSGVYFTEDMIVAYGARRESPGARGAADRIDPADDLAEENRRLRAEIERLRRGQG